MRTMRWCLLGVVLAFGLAAGPSAAFGYDQYSVNKDATNCRLCHGDFRAASYTSLVDGMDWGNLHDLHRATMLGNDCSTCHGANFFPVMTNSSTGGNGLPAIACVGCHGRAEDDVAANPDFGMLGGYGAGLRQHHAAAGVTACAGCHDDAVAANYTPVGEEVLPPYYGLTTNHPAMPVDPCNADGSEDFAGATQGVDNDGDDLYDGDDPDCAAPTIDAGVPDAAPGTPDAAPPDAEPGTPDAAPGLPDAGPGQPDAGGGDGDGDGGGCCRTSPGGFASSSSLALFVIALLWRRRRR